MSKNTNDEKYKEFLNKKIMKYVIIILSLIIIILEVLALLKKISMLWGLALFVLLYILKKKY